MPARWKSSVERPGSIGFVAGVGGSGKPARSASRCGPSNVPTQSGRPTTGTRGSPFTPASVRHDETPGYGCEIGPGNHLSTEATLPVVVNGTNRSRSSGVRRAMSRQVSTILRERSQPA
jgi:hypothetical protein